MRTSSLLRTAAWGVVATGVALPVIRRRAKLPPAVTIAGAAAAPVALCVALPRSRARDCAMCALQMYAYTAAYKMPADDPDALERRVLIDYVVKADRALGLGVLPTVRLQRALAIPGRVRPAEQVLVWSHWLWFLVPHGTVAYTVLRRPELFPFAAGQIYGTFDVGLTGYWATPTAPPWYASEHGHLGPGKGIAVRRMMVEHGEAFWRERWAHLYSVFGGNPLAAMPSLHFATSVQAARVLTRAGHAQGAAGWAYTATLGFALVYLGEHYVTDLLAGLALAMAVRRLTPAATGPLQAVSRSIQRLEARAHTT